MKIAIHSDTLSFISDDSREVFNAETTPSNCAFLITQSNANYVESAKQNGFKIFITPKDLPNYLDLNLKLVGLTGTYGKPTTAAMIYSILLDF